MSLNRHLYFLFIVMGLSFILALPTTSYARRERPSNTQEYSNKNREERKNFDRNFGRYQNLSPSQRREKLDKWREFKQNTTPEERDYILHKMRDKKHRRHDR